MQFGVHAPGLFWIFEGSCCIGLLLPDAVFCLVSRDVGAEMAQKWDACARDAIRKRLLLDVCSNYLSRNASVDGPGEGCSLPAEIFPTLFSFKLFMFGDTKEVKYKTK